MLQFRGYRTIATFRNFKALRSNLALNQKLSTFHRYTEKIRSCSKRNVQANHYSYSASEVQLYSVMHLISHTPTYLVHGYRNQCNLTTSCLQLSAVLGSLRFWQKKRMQENCILLTGRCNALAFEI